VLPLLAPAARDGACVLVLYCGPYLGRSSRVDQDSSRFGIKRPILVV
jgi:hypothetical protein